jgi:hypothetical protein
MQIVEQRLAGQVLHGKIVDAFALIFVVGPLRPDPLVDQPFAHGQGQPVVIVVGAATGIIEPEAGDNVPDNVPFEADHRVGLEKSGVPLKRGNGGIQGRRSEGFHLACLAHGISLGSIVAVWFGGLLLKDNTL